MRKHPRDRRIAALVTELTRNHGFAKEHGAMVATSVVEKVASRTELPLVAVFSRDPKVSPVVIPESSMPPTVAVVQIPLAHLFEGLGDV